MTANPRHEQKRARFDARLAAIQALYQMEMSSCDANDVIEEFITHRFAGEGGHYQNPDTQHFGDVVRGVVTHQADIDKAIEAALAQGWTLGRLDSTLRALLRAGAYELFMRADIPARVVINEYVDVAHAFFEAAEPGIVNGVLDHMARDVRGAEFAGNKEESGDVAPS